MSDLAALSRSPLDALAAEGGRIAAARLEALGAFARLSFRARDEAAIARAGEAFGIALPREACRYAESDGRMALWLGPDEWLLVVPDGDGPALAATIGAALAGLPHSLVDVSHRSVALEVAGPEAASVLNAGCPLDLSPGAFPVGMGTRTVLGKTEIILLRTAPDRFRVDVWRSFTAYAWHYLDEARREFL